MPTTTYPVRFSSRVLGEFEAMLESGVDPVEEPELHEVLDAVRSAEVVIKRNSNRYRNHTYEAHLSSLDAVVAFAKEVAYYIDHNEGCLSECDGWGREDITAVLNGCKTALKSANKVLVEAGLPEVTSYFD